MILTVLIICAILTVGILIGIQINQYFGKDNYWKGYDDGCNDTYDDAYWKGYEKGSESIDELYSVARKNGYADGYDDCMQEYNIEESSYKPTPSEFLEQFEEFLNSNDEVSDDFDKGWLSAEKYIKENYTLIPKFDAVTTDAVNAVEDITEEIDKMKDINLE